MNKKTRKWLKGVVKEEITPLGIALIGGAIIVEAYSSYGTSRMGLVQMAVGGIVIIGAVGLYYLQKEFKALKK